jgi:hypothetical protein
VGGGNEGERGERTFLNSWLCWIPWGVVTYEEAVLVLEVEHMARLHQGSGGFISGFVSGCAVGFSCAIEGFGLPLRPQKPQQLVGGRLLF